MNKKEMKKEIKKLNRRIALHSQKIDELDYVLSEHILGHMEINVVRKRKE